MSANVRLPRVYIWRNASLWGGRAGASVQASASASGNASQFSAVSCCGGGRCEGDARPLGPLRPIRAPPPGPLATSIRKRRFADPVTRRSDPQGSTGFPEISLAYTPYGITPGYTPGGIEGPPDYFGSHQGHLGSTPDLKLCPGNQPGLMFRKRTDGSQMGPLGP